MSSRATSRSRISSPVVPCSPSINTLGFAISSSVQTSLCVDQICLRRERVGKEFAVRQPALSNEVASCSVDHRRCTARVHLKRGKIGQIVHDSPMNEARADPATRPRAGFRQHRDIVKIRLLASPRFGQLRQVQILAAACTPIQVDRARWSCGVSAVDALMECMLCDRLDRSKAGAAGKQHDRARVVFAQEKRTERRFDPQNVALFDRWFECPEQSVSKHTAWRVAHM